MFVLILTVVGAGLLYVLVAKFINENNAKNVSGAQNCDKNRGKPRKNCEYQ